MYYSIIALILIVLIFLIYFNSCRSSYFGSGPAIFTEDNSYGYYAPEYHVEPIYRKITLPLIT